MIYACIIIIIIIAVILTTLSTRQPRQSPHKVVLLGIDGLGAQNLKQAHTPNLDSMHYQETNIDPNSYASGPNWVAMLTGHNSDTSGVKNNDCKMPAHKTLFDEYTSAVYTQWDNIKCYSDNIQRYAYVPWTDQQLFDETRLNDTLHGNESFVFIHIDVLDSYSHRYGADSDAYTQALAALDNTLLPILLTYNLVVSADHGSQSTGHSYDKVPILTQHKTDHSDVYNIIRDML